MGHPDNPKWVRTEDALLTALGCTAVPESPLTSVYRLLALPTFHRPCCVQVTLRNEAHHVRLAVLTEGASYAITSLAWAGAATVELEDAILTGMLAALDVEAPITLDRDPLARRPTPTVDPDDEAVRDGLVLRLDLLDGRPHGTVRAQLSSTRRSPELAEWITFFLNFGRLPEVPPPVAAALGNLGTCL